MNTIENLKAQLDISRLLHEYARCIDAGDFAGAGQLFAHATVSSSGSGEIHGAAAAQAMYEQYTRRYPDDGTPHTQHCISNIVIDIAASGLSAQSCSYFHVLQATEKLPLQPICAGRYEDEFALVDGQWQFSRRTIRVDLVGNLSQHLLKAIPH